MAACHLRSISLPSRSHPLVVATEEQFYKLKASQSSSMSYKLNGLKNLFECIDGLLQLPQAQQTLFHERQSQRKGKDSGMTTEVDAYMVSRKKLSKVVCKCLRNLKRKERNCTAAALDKNSNLINMIARLKRVQEISLEVLKSILSFISQPKAKSKPSGWSIISKALQSKRISCEVEIEVNEVEKIDAELLILKSSKDISISQLQNLLKGLKALDSSIQEAEEELECIYRQLVKTRVSLLNIQNH
ncbi:hypothetical protein GH714_014732 [Hevea brasiliensis]|uniref:Uncharacterized protein n=1 Tax=Hevea brasiliensis TaxID=3981 RepID=A0A6A6K4M5_HEVBR|nr:hypothetical protein GH714_014732 [Hevea brasiliensis]